MSRGDEYEGLKITPEMLETLAVPIIVKKAKTSGLFKPAELKALFDKGQQPYETGIREIGSILARGDIPDPDTWDKGIRKITFGAINLGVFLAAIKSRSGPKKGGNTTGKKNTEKAERWKKPVRDRVAELHRENPRMPGTRITNAIIKTPPPGISLPRYDEIYELVSPVLKALKQRMK